MPSLPDRDVTITLSPADINSLAKALPTPAGSRRREDSIETCQCLIVAAHMQYGNLCSSPLVEPVMTTLKVLPSTAYVTKVCCLLLLNSFFPGP